MAATKVQMNWSTVTFNTVALTRITNGSFGQGGSLIKFSGDVDLFPTVIVNNMNDPHASFTSADIGTFMGFAPGTTATLAATLEDAKLQTGGAIVFSLINAVFENADGSDAHAAFGTVTATWQAYSSDGSTNPLSFTRS